MNGKLALVVPVRDEADIIADMLDFHLSQGVDFAVVLDNGSVDGTADILRDLQRWGYPLTILRDPSRENKHAEWGNHMVAEAKAQGAGWVIAADADEFWFPGNYRQEMEGYPHNVLRSHWMNFLPNLGFHWKDLRTVGDFEGKQYENWIPKVAFRTETFVGIEQGFHNVSVGDRREGQSSRVVYHYPIRSYEQFERKVINAGTSHAHIANRNMAWHTRGWYEQYQAGRLRDVYTALVLAAHKNQQRDDTMFNYWHHPEVTL